MCNFFFDNRDFQNNSLDTIPAAFVPPKAVVLLYVLLYQLIVLPARIYIAQFSCIVCWEYGNLIARDLKILVTSSISCQVTACADLYFFDKGNFIA